MPRPSVGGAASSRRPDDLASTDEVKVYKDEGDEDDGKSAGENLSEEKLGLLTETEQLKDTLSPASRRYLARREKLPTADGDARVLGYNPFSAGHLSLHPFFPYTSYSPYRQGSAIAAAGLGNVPPLLPPSAAQCLYMYNSSRADHHRFQQSPNTPPGLSSPLHIASRTSGFSHTGSVYQLPSSLLTPPNQFSHPLFSSDLAHGACFDHLSRNTQCGYPMPFSASYLTPPSLSSFPLARFNTPDYFSPQPGISSTYPGISHPALVTACPAASMKDFMSPPSCYSPGDSARSFHSWFPRHCPSTGHTPSAQSCLSEPPPNCLSSPEPSGASTINQSPSERGVNGGGFSRHHGVPTYINGMGSGCSRDRLQHVRKKISHIKKPLNAFMLFMKEMRSKVVDECTLKESAAINQILGRKWHSLDRSEQARYYEMARREKLLHKQLFPGWSARDNYALLARKAKRKAIVHRPIHRPSLSVDSNDHDASAAKKCRARYGLEHMNRWCKPCRRKKRCIRFTDGADDTSIVAPAAADSTSGADPDQPLSKSDDQSDRQSTGHLDVSSASASSVRGGGACWPSPPLYTNDMSSPTQLRPTPSTATR